MFCLRVWEISLVLAFGLAFCLVLCFLRLSPTCCLFNTYDSISNDTPTKTETDNRRSGSR